MKVQFIKIIPIIAILPFIATSIIANESDISKRKRMTEAEFLGTKKGPVITNRKLTISTNSKKNLEWKEVGCTDTVPKGCTTIFELEIKYEFDYEGNGVINEKINFEGKVDFPCPIYSFNATPVSVTFQEPYNETKKTKKVKFELILPCDCPGGTFEVIARHADTELGKPLVKSNGILFNVPSCP